MSNSLPSNIILCREWFKNHSSFNITSLLEEIEVMGPGMWENEDGPKGWYAVSNTYGIIAYFPEEKEALRYRLDYINRLLND
jgi:hypothetical protein